MIIRQLFQKIFIQFIINNILYNNLNLIHNKKKLYDIILMKENNDKIFIELIKNQKKNIQADKKLLYNDIKRISKYLNKSIFNDECSIWTGYITVIKNDKKNSYINFFYNGKKYALQRLLYINYMGNLNDSEYIKFTCENKGRCCNVNHFYKIKDNDNDEPTIVQVDKEKPLDITVGFE